MNSLAALFGLATAVLLLVLALLQQPVEQQQSVIQSLGAVEPAVLEGLAAELNRLRSVLKQQQEDAAAQLAMVQRLDAAAVQGAASASAAAAQAAASAPAAAAQLAPLTGGRAGGAGDSGVRVAAERTALAACKEDDVPILKMLRSPCPDGRTGYACDVRWDLQERFLPAGREWLVEWRASRAAVTDCQRGFFDALQAAMTEAHWQDEWDAQPFRLAASPPRTIGKMLHQIAMVNYYHLTLPPRLKPKLRKARLPGEHYVQMPQPGFRWNILDYGGDNVIARTLDKGKRCAGSASAWHCLWQRFPQQARLGGAAVPPPGSVLAAAASEIFNMSRNGRSPVKSVFQYVLASAVSQVFTTPTAQLHAYMNDHLKVICHQPGPYCGGSADEVNTPVAAMHVRHGDSCDRRSDKPGPWNAMFAWDEKKGKLDRVSYRLCYSWSVYRAELRRLQKEYGVRTVLLATDDADGSVMKELRAEKELNFVFLDFPRTQFVKRGWMEFRRDQDEHVALCL